MDEGRRFACTGKREEAALTVEDFLVVVLEVVEEVVPFLESHRFDFGEGGGTGDKEWEEIVVRGQGAVSS